MSCASSMIRRPAWPARTFSQWPDTRPPPCSLACSMIESAAASASGIDASMSQRVRHRDRHQHVDPAALAGRQLDRRRDDLLVVAVVADVHEHRVVLRLVVDDRLRDRDLVRRREVEALAAAVERVDDDADEQPAGADRRHLGLRTTMTTNAIAVNAPADEREQRRVVAADADVAGPAVGPLEVRPRRAQARDRAWAIVNESSAPNE